MDAFANAQSRKGATVWMSVNWDAWESRSNAEEHKSSNGGPPRFEIGSAEGLAVFDRLFTLRGVNQIVVSISDLQARLNTWVRHDHQDPLPSKLISTEARQTHTSQGAKKPPRNVLERGIAAIWQDLLGIESVNIDDDFFTLGGDSLLATRLVSRLSDAFHVNLRVASIFDHPTIAGLAEIIGNMLIEEIECLDETEAVRLIDNANGAASFTLPANVDQG
jgi:acyl carrier protein